LLIDDTLESAADQSYESYLQLAHQLTPKRDGQAFVVPFAAKHMMRIESLSPDCQASEARGQKEPLLQGWYTKGYREMGPRSALTFACAGKSRRITLLVSFHEAGRMAGMARAKAAAASSN
jgi:hypothetical protein